MYLGCHNSENNVYSHAKDLSNIFIEYIYRIFLSNIFIEYILIKYKNKYTKIRLKITLKYKNY